MLKNIFLTQYHFLVAMYYNPLKCVSMNNQECRARPEVVNINTNEPLFYPCSIKINKFCGSCNDIND